MIVSNTDVLIDALRGRADATERIERALESGVLATTAITVFELRSGARSASASERVETLLAALPILPFDQAAANEASGVRRQLEGTGLPVVSGTPH